MENFKKKFSNFVKNYDPSKKYITEPSKSLDEIFENINNKKSWNLKEAKRTVDSLYEYQRIHFKNNNKDKEKQIEFYIKYLNHQIDVLDDFQAHLLTLVATIFLPLSFITGFFGMNFKSMGVPSLKNGIFTIKSASEKIILFSIILTIITIYIYYGVLKTS